MLPETHDMFAPKGLSVPPSVPIDRTLGVSLKQRQAMAHGTRWRGSACDRVNGTRTVLDTGIRLVSSSRRMARARPDLRIRSVTGGAWTAKSSAWDQGRQWYEAAQLTSGFLQGGCDAVARVPFL